MTDIALHAHTNVQWVSWRIGRTGFGRIHLTRPGKADTLCDVAIPFRDAIARVVRNQETAALEDLCKSCLKEYSLHH